MLIHGGWYLDLDVGVDCVADHQERTQSKEGIAAACTNVVANLEKAAGLQPHRATHPSVPVTAALFWEHRPLTYQEQMETALRPCREGLPEHRIRLANYGFWCTAGCLALQRILHLSFMRLQRFQHKPGNAGRQCDVRALDLQRGKEYTVLYSTGPDVCTEAVFGKKEATTTIRREEEEEEEEEDQQTKLDVGCSLGVYTHTAKCMLTFLCAIAMTLNKRCKGSWE